MGQIQYLFNPQEDISELTDFFYLLHRYHPDIPADPQGIFELEERIKECQTKNSDLEQKLKEAEGKLKESKDNVDQLSQQIKDKEKDIENLKIEPNRIREEKEEEIASLKKQIADLEEKLAVYEPSLSGDTRENRFFKIDGSNLSETLDNAAPFVGKVDSKGNAIFTFNVDKGQHRHYSQNPSELESFCEIIDRIDGANHIGLGEWGKGEYKGWLLTVTEKAKIKLTRV